MKPYVWFNTLAHEEVCIYAYNVDDCMNRLIQFLYLVDDYIVLKDDLVFNEDNDYGYIMDVTYKEEVNYL